MFEPGALHFHIELGLANCVGAVAGGLWASVLNHIFFFTLINNEETHKGLSVASRTNNAACLPVLVEKGFQG